VRRADTYGAVLYYGGRYGVAESNARLPRGINNIRQHIADVDDVPLLISLFSGCTPTSTSEMIAIMQEHGKRVCCIGSSLNSFAAHAFAQCDMSISLDPLQSHKCLTLDPVSRPQFVIHGSAPEPLSKTVRRAETTASTVAAHFNTIPCSLGLHRDADMTLMKLIREARLYCLNVRQVFGFVAFTQCTLAVLNLASSVLFLPPVMGEGDLLWMCLVPIPILSLSLLGTPPEPRLERVFMGEIDIKTELGKKIKLFAWYLFWRGVPIACALIFIFAAVM
jgi:magnesium-transporting ATPase (P-type)